MSEAPDPLGNITKLAATLRKLDDRVLRFMLQSAARSLLPNERIKICYRHRLPETRMVKVAYHTKKGFAALGGLMKCQSVWVCPVCAASITEKRRYEMSEALSRNRDKVLPYMITYTVSHSRQDSLEKLLTNMLEAYRRLRSHSAFKLALSEYRIIGSVRSLEVTYGENGWHPHVHELFLQDVKKSDYKTFPPDLQAQGLESEIAGQWVDTLKKSHLTASLAHGVKVLCTQGDIAAYLEKYGKIPQEKSGEWTTTHELTKAGQKKGRIEGKTPFELLIESVCGVESSGAAFVEFAEAFKGKAQLRWSPGTRDLLGIGADETETIEEPEGEEWKILAHVDWQQWKVVLQNEAVAGLVQQANKGDAQAVWTFLDKLPGMIMTRRAGYRSEEVSPPPPERESGV